MSTLRVNNMTNVGGTGPTYAPGHIIQTQSLTLRLTASSTSTSFAATALTLGITPKSTTSKILVTINGTMQVANSGNSGVGTIYRGSSSGELATNLAVTETYMTWTSVAAAAFSSGISASKLDSPNTTSPVYYTWAFRSSTSGQTVYAWENHTITLMEVAA